MHVLAARAGPPAARGHAAALALRWPLRVAGCDPPHPDQSPHVACWRDCEAVSDPGPWHRPGQGFRVVPAVRRGRRIAGAASGPVEVCTAHRHTCADAAIRMAAAFCMLRCAVRGSARGKTPVGQPGRQRCSPAFWETPALHSQNAEQDLHRDATLTFWPMESMLDARLWPARSETAPT